MTQLHGFPFMTADEFHDVNICESPNSFLRVHTSLQLWPWLPVISGDLKMG